MKKTVLILTIAILATSISVFGMERCRGMEGLTREKLQKELEGLGNRHPNVAGGYPIKDVLIALDQDPDQEKGPFQPALKASDKKLVFVKDPYDIEDEAVLLVANNFHKDRYLYAVGVVADKKTGEFRYLIISGGKYKKEVYDAGVAKSPGFEVPVDPAHLSVYTRADLDDEKLSYDLKTLMDKIYATPSFKVFLEDEKQKKRLEFLRKEEKLLELLARPEFQEKETEK